MGAQDTDRQAASYWCINNPLSTYKDYWDRIKALTESERQESRQARRLKKAYEDTVKCLDGWLKWLGAREAMPTTGIVELYHKSPEIESRLFRTTLSLENLYGLRNELQSLIRDIEAVEKDQASLADLRNRAPPLLWELVETSNYNTICITPDCHSNCHLQCTLELSEPQDLGGWCKVFKTLGIPNQLLPFWSNSSVKCSKCKHEASEHRNYRQIYQERPSPIYGEAVQKLQDAETSANNLREAINCIEGEINDEMNSVFLSPNYAGYIRSAIRLLEIRKKYLESRPDTEAPAFWPSRGRILIM